MALITVMVLSGVPKPKKAMVYLGEKNAFAKLAKLHSGACHRAAIRSKESLVDSNVKTRLYTDGLARCLNQKLAGT